MLKIKILGILLFGIVCASLGAYAWDKTHSVHPVEKIVVKEVEKPVYKYVKSVDQNDISELRKAYGSRIDLSHTENGSIMTVTATDGYKETTAKWEIYEKPDYTGEIIVGSIVAVAVCLLTVKVTTGKPSLGFTSRFK